MRGMSGLFKVHGDLATDFIYFKKNIVKKRSLVGNKKKLMPSNEEGTKKHFNTSEENGC